MYELGHELQKQSQKPKHPNPKSLSCFSTKREHSKSSAADRDPLICREKMGRKKGVVEFDETAPDFDPADPYKDPVAMLEMREHIVREKWIDIEKAKILREKVKWCYRVEGVNHLQKCRHLVRQYLDSTRGIGWGKDGRHPSLHGPKVESVESE